MSVRALVERPEGKTLECRRDLSSPLNVLRSVVAFANTAGGTILIGVDNGSRAIVGVSDPRVEEEHLTNLIMDSIRPRMLPDVSIVNGGDQALLRVDVFPSDRRPHYVTKLGHRKGVKPWVASRMSHGMMLSY